MWCCTDIRNQVDLLLISYPNLKFAEETHDQILLCGSIDVYRSACDFVLNKQYQINIIIPYDTDKLPSVVDMGNAISNTYPHKYADNSLCLETDASIKNRFVDGFDLTAWMDEFVEPYFFSYEYYHRYGEFPFGERPHGLLGMIDTYQDLFGESDPAIACKLLTYTAEQKYRGHAPCPCGSGKKTRQCHGPNILPFITDPRRLRIIQSDLQNMRNQLLEYEKSKRNSKYAK